MNILLADDHRILRTGLKLLLASQDDCHVVAEASRTDRKSWSGWKTRLSTSSCWTFPCRS